ncbi:hypothetical protein D3C87_2161740 [compost metagenome]
MHHAASVSTARSSIMDLLGEAISPRTSLPRPNIRHSRTITTLRVNRICITGRS